MILFWLIYISFATFIYYICIIYIFALYYCKQFSCRAVLKTTYVMNAPWIKIVIIIIAWSFAKHTALISFPPTLTPSGTSSSASVIIVSVSTTEIQISFFVVWNSWYFLIFLFRFPSNFLTSRDINPPNYRGIWACSQAVWLKQLSKMTK